MWAHHLNPLILAHSLQKQKEAAGLLNWQNLFRISITLILHIYLRPGVLRFMGLQRIRNDWVTELNWTYIFKPVDGFLTFDLM